MNTDNVTYPAPNTLLEAVRYFSDLGLCTWFFISLRWRGEPICPRCGGVGANYIMTRRIFKCKIKECRKQFSVKTGIMFEDSAIGLDKWFLRTCVKTFYVCLPSRRQKPEFAGMTTLFR